MSFTSRLWWRSLLRTRWKRDRESIRSQRWIALETSGYYCSSTSRCRADPNEDAEEDTLISSISLVGCSVQLQEEVLKKEKVWFVESLEIICISGKRLQLEMKPYGDVSPPPDHSVLSRDSNRKGEISKVHASNDVGECGRRGGDEELGEVREVCVICQWVLDDPIKNSHHCVSGV